MNNPEAQAREWFLLVQTSELSDQQQEELADWLCASSENLQAYQNCETVWESLGSLEKSQKLEAARRGETVRRGGFWSSIREFAEGLIGDGKKVWMVPGAAAAGVMALGLFVWMGQGMPNDEWRRYETGMAEITTFKLEDGSQVTLGANSSIRTSLGGEIRKVDIHNGRVYFDVSSKPDQPFHVKVVDARIEVIGTQFDVNRVNHRVNVSVVEGVVSVSPADEPTSITDSVSVVLRRGEGVTKEQNQPLSAIKTVAEQQASSWREGRLVYRNTSLEEIVDEINRYSRYRITLASPDLHTMELTASFEVDELDVFPELLSKSLPVSVRLESENHYIVFSR